MRVGAIIPAAGRSRRMGTPKLVLPLAGSTLVARVVDAFLGAPVDSVAVVIRPDDWPLRAALAGRPLLFAENPDSAGDMLSSVRCGLRALPATTEVVAISPADQPSLEPTLIQELLAAFRSGGGSILVPTHGGRRGHPLVFHARFREELLSRHDGAGLRGLLHSHPAEVVEWPTSHAAVLEDVDTPEDYHEVCKAAGGIPQSVAALGSPRRERRQPEG